MYTSICMKSGLTGSRALGLCASGQILKHVDSDPYAKQAALYCRYRVVGYLGIVVGLSGVLGNHKRSFHGTSHVSRSSPRILRVRKTPVQQCCHRACESPRPWQKL